MTDETKPTKIAVVRCDIVSETCPGVGCFKAFNERKSHFEAYGKDAQIIAFFTCGGCSGRRVYRLLKALKQYELDAVHLSSCMLMEDSYPKCPHLDTIRKTIRDAGIKVVEGTHH
ncbi:TPA: CGGC domain-containing protein [Methanosarcina acetivorans]|uniref:CGGC domain-containing protein n=1 Tax=Methanosarcina acetivorans TaxID=2214 RepID=A0A832SFU8_9EURY|nr:CGGC domain-containing protein [Methanosarcina acetivorans]HIH93117.1 CGGC domain-containing protein [Methanosarcina acetivorans]